MTEAEILQKQEKMVENFDRISDLLFTRDGKIDGILIAYLPNDRVAIAPMDWRDEREKAATLEAFSDFMKMNQAIAYAQVTETWYAVPTGDPAVDRLAPSQRSDRKEQVLYMIKVRGRKPLICTREIIRDEKSARLGPLERPAIDGLTGRMTELLGDEVTE